MHYELKIIKHTPLSEGILKQFLTQYEIQVFSGLLRLIIVYMSHEEKREKRERVRERKEKTRQNRYW